MKPETCSGAGRVDGQDVEVADVGGGGDGQHAAQPGGHRGDGQVGQGALLGPLTRMAAQFDWFAPSPNLVTRCAKKQTNTAIAPPHSTAVRNSPSLSLKLKSEQVQSGWDNFRDQRQPR